MNGVLGYLGYTGPGDPPEDDEMHELTLPAIILNHYTNKRGRNNFFRFFEN